MKVDLVITKSGETITILEPKPGLGLTPAQMHKVLAEAQALVHTKEWWDHPGNKEVEIILEV